MLISIVLDFHGLIDLVDLGLEGFLKFGDRLGEGGSWVGVGGRGGIDVIRCGGCSSVDVVIGAVKGDFATFFFGIFGVSGVSGVSNLIKNGRSTSIDDGSGVGGSSIDGICFWFVRIGRFKLSAGVELSRLDRVGGSCSDLVKSGQNRSIEDGSGVRGSSIDGIC